MGIFEILKFDFNREADKLDFEARFKFTRNQKTWTCIVCGSAEARVTFVEHAKCFAPQLYNEESLNVGVRYCLEHLHSTALFQALNNFGLDFYKKLV